MKTADEAKLDAARECIREHLAHVKPNGAACYESRLEAIQAARDVIVGTEKLDSSQINRAFAPFMEV